MVHLMLGMIQYFPTTLVKKCPLKRNIFSTGQMILQCQLVKSAGKQNAGDWLQESCTQALYIYRSLLDCNFIDLISYLILDEKLSLK